MEVSPALAERLRGRIRADGPITFAAFMEAALYDADGGFYTTAGSTRSAHPVGEGGHFVTSPHVSSVFGTLLASFAAEVWRRLGRPEQFTLIEVGAGDGTLARTVAANLRDRYGLGGALRYVGVERAEGARRALAGALAEYDGSAVASLDGIGADEGLVFANELLDNLPFHIVRRRSDGSVLESRVGLNGERFVFVEGQPSSGEVERIGRRLALRSEGVASPAALEFVERVPQILGRGYALLIDYASTSAALAGAGSTVHGYRLHRAEPDVLDDPGSKDITAGVDFASLAETAESRGISTWGPIPQRELLITLGLKRWERAAAAAQARAVSERRGVEAARLYSARHAAGLLINRAGLGAFDALCLGVGVTEPPLGFAKGLAVDVADDEEHASKDRDQVRHERPG